jgi:molybdopterin molybdotransferase
VRRSVLESLTIFLKSGGRKVYDWYASLPLVEVDFDDQAAAFSNINTREELASFEEGKTMAATTVETAAPASAISSDALAPTASRDALARTATRDALARVVSCMDDYDPNALKVEKAREVIRSFLTPIATNEKVSVRAALGRVLGEDIISTLDVPAYDNSAMDGYALRHADLKPAQDT